MQLKKMIKKQIVRFSEFMVGGGAQFWAGYGAFAVADKLLGWPFVLAKTGAYFFGASVNFGLERFWVFGGKNSKRDAVQSAEKFYTLMIINFLLDLAIVGGLKKAGVSPYIGQFISAALSTVWNYFLFSKWVFVGAKAKSR